MSQHNPSYHARVVHGGMGNTVHGDYRYTDNSGVPPERPATLPELLEDLGEALRQAREAGRIDEATLREVRKELDLAAGLSTDDAPETRNRFVLAMRKCKGMVENVSTLAAKIAQVIAVVQAGT